MVVGVFLILRVDSLLPLAEAGQRVVGMVRDGQVFLQWTHPPDSHNTGHYWADMQSETVHGQSLAISHHIYPVLPELN